MNILLLHGYGLKRSGSNVFINNLASNLCDLGHNVHMVCQSHLEEVESSCNAFIEYNAELRVETAYRNSQFARSGNLYIHKPYIGNILPVYNYDKYKGFEQVQTYSEITKNDLESYFKKNFIKVENLCKSFQVDIILANHILGMPEIARRVHEALGIPFVINPHGSSIEYSIKPNPGYIELCKKSLAQCSSIIVGSEEMKTRINSIWGDEFDHKMVQINMAVNTKLFRPEVHFNKTQVVKTDKQQYSANFFNTFYNNVRTDNLMTLQRKIVDIRTRYDQEVNDEDISEKFPSENELKKIVYAGKMIVGKGVHNLILSLVEHKDVELYLAGEGTFRPCLELIIRCLMNGNHELLTLIVQNGQFFDGKKAETLACLKPLLNRSYFDTISNLAIKNNLKARVKFLGYLKHSQLVQLYSVCDYLFLTSEVKEAYPLCLIEAAASGLIPIATDTGGNKEFLDRLSAVAFSSDINLVIDVKHGKVLNSISEKISELKKYKFKKDSMTSYIKNNYDSQTVTKKYLGEFSNRIYGEDGNNVRRESISRL